MKSLVILAAGMGSRFGGLKQIEPLGPNGEFIIDYSIYDAIKAGFEKVVFVIKRENYEIFKNTIGSRVEDKIKVEYAFQENEVNPDVREKPLGTAHAIMATEKFIDGPFMIINADDYYGTDAFNKASLFLSNMEENVYGLVGYKAANTMTENGSVKRGICTIEDGYLVNILESKIYKDGDTIKASPLSSEEEFEISSDTLVSMNMLLFNETLFKYLKDDYKEFLDNADLLKDEFLIPSVLDKHIKNGDIKVKVIDTTSTWYGVTYKEDAPAVKEALAKLHTDGTYERELW